MSQTRPPLVTLTDAAAKRVQEIMSEKGAGFLRMGVKKGGCAGMEYVMDYVEAPEATDEVVEDKGVKVLVDAGAVLYLIGMQIDFEKSLFSSKFTFSNPQQSDACGCGMSVTLNPFEGMAEGASEPQHGH